MIGSTQAKNRPVIFLSLAYAPVELEPHEKIRSRPNVRVFLINTEGVIDLNLDYYIDGVTQEEIL